MSMTDKDTHRWLNLAHQYAIKHSGCCKVAVGTVLVDDMLGSDRAVAMGANRTMPVLCNSSEQGCLRVQKYGNDSKVHRNPEDCRAIHSEIDAICYAARLGFITRRTTAYVTRYPCEACARALVTAGIYHVIYGGTAEISSTTAEIFKTNNMLVIHVTDWKEDNTDR